MPVQYKLSLITELLTDHYFPEDTKIRYKADNLTRAIAEWANKLGAETPKAGTLFPPPSLWWLPPDGVHSNTSSILHNVCFCGKNQETRSGVRVTNLFRLDPASPPPVKLGTPTAVGSWGPAPSDTTVYWDDMSQVSLLRQKRSFLEKFTITPSFVRSPPFTPIPRFPFLLLLQTNFQWHLSI